MVRAVIFDLDGVLVDSEQVWDDARRGERLGLVQLAHEHADRAAAHQPDVGGLAVADPVGGHTRRRSGQDALRLLHERPLDAAPRHRSLDATGVVHEHLRPRVEWRRSDRLHERRSHHPTALREPIERDAMRARKHARNASGAAA